MDKPTYSFAGVELDTAKRQIRGKSETVEPPPLVFDALVILASRSDQVISKDELTSMLWPNRVVSEASISQVIRKARVALEECGAEPNVIKTQHGHGYRLDAEVTVSQSESPDNKWQEHPVRTGAIIALLGGTLVTLANISDILQWVVPDDSVEMLETTQSTVESTDAKIDEVVRLLRDQAARTGDGLDPDSERTIRIAVAAIVGSADSRKASALSKLSEGDVEGAAEAIVAVANDLDAASAGSVDAAVESWREAGAIYYTSNVDKAISSFEAAYQLRPDDPVIAFDLGLAYLRAGRRQDAGSLFESVASAEVSEESRSDALRGVGIVSKLNGDYDDALEYFERALIAADSVEDRRRRSLILLQQGSVAQARGDNELARRHFQTAVDYAEEFGDEHLLARSLNNLGIVLAVTGQYEEADQVLNDANSVHETRHDLAGQAEVLGNLGANALLREDLDSAETYLMRSVDIGEQLGWQRSIARDLINLGTIAASRQQFDVARDRLERALEIVVSADLNELHPMILANMGEVARDSGDEEEACRLWREAVPPLREMQHAALDIVVRNQEELACAHE